MKVTICQLPDIPGDLESVWAELCDHAKGSDLVVLPELPFHPWVGWTDAYDPAVWDDAVAAHEKWLGRLGELGASTVAGSAPVGSGFGERHNRAFTWSGGEIELSHDKYYLPEEPGFWEATWYQRGDGSFRAVEVNGHLAGFLLCTEMWFTDRAREYARQGVGLLLSPRVTEEQTVDKWLAGGRAAAVMGGAFSISSNRVGSNHDVDFGGVGWVIDPDGDILATTSETEPYVTIEIDLDHAVAAKKTYPRYVEE